MCSISSQIYASELISSVWSNHVYRQYLILLPVHTGTIVFTLILSKKASNSERDGNFNLKFLKKEEIRKSGDKNPAVTHLK
ncbi:hypothetical protein BIV59_22515 [Bacillus sp. MUM 13]|nr:hypothetical protein BIV59_22515 [Bacillus sp. MUM 13]